MEKGRSAYFNNKGSGRRHVSPKYICYNYRSMNGKYKIGKRGFLPFIS